MDDTSGIRLLAAMVDIVRDKDGSAKLLTELQAHEDAAAKSLAQAAKINTDTTAKTAQVQTLRDETARLRDEMLTKLKPREDEVARGALMLQQFQKDTKTRNDEITARETEMTRRENAAAAREKKIETDEAALRDAKARVAKMKESYETKLSNIRKAATG